MNRSQKEAGTAAISSLLVGDRACILLQGWDEKLIFAEYMFLGWYVKMHLGADTLSKLFYLSADVTALYATTPNNYLGLSDSS